MRHITKVFGIISIMIFFACGSNSSNPAKNSNQANNPGTKQNAPKENFTPASSEPIDEALAEKGKEIFNSKCVSCHKMDSKLIGPPMNGVTKKRSSAWLVDMIHKPEEMTKNDPIAKQLLKEYNGIQMTSMGATKEDAKAIVEYLKLNDQ